MAAPLTHRAWQFVNTKTPLEANIQINSTAPIPTPKRNQHLVQVIAAALNPIDYKPAEILLLSYLAIRKPATPCNDVSGRIIIPAADSGFKTGQLVCGTVGDNPLAGGALAEFALAEAEQGSLTAVPEGVDMVDAATLGVAGLTAYQSIVPNVKKGDKIFINGGSGGCGVLGLQIAKILGCHVTTSCSTKNIELCKSLGADKVIDYREQHLLGCLIASGGFDLVVDNVANDSNLYYRCHEYTTPTAVFIKVGGMYYLDMMTMLLWPSFLGGGKRKLLPFLTKTSQDELAQVVAWMKEGKLKAVIDEKFAFEDAPQAFLKLKTGRAKGKIVVDVASGAYKQVQ